MTANTYDEYGILGASNTTRFGYTGQVDLSELGLLYYKARMYDPKIGRFLQTDPIGYDDGMNWYAYVGGDPINMVDPYGLEDCPPNDPDCVVVTGPRRSCTAICLENLPAINITDASWLNDILDVGKVVVVWGKRKSKSYQCSTKPSFLAPTVGVLANESAANSMVRFNPFTALVGFLFLSGDTPQYRQFRHYGYAADAPYFANGLRPDSYATTANGSPLTGEQAQTLLALPTRERGFPDAYYNVNINSSVPVIGPRKVDPRFGQPGGGVEYLFPKETPPGSVTGPYPINKC